MLDVSAGRQTQNELINNIFQAKQINAVLGGNFFTPWDIDNLPDTEIDTILSIIDDLPGYIATRKKIDSYKQQWRNKHPGYRYKN